MEYIISEEELEELNLYIKNWLIIEDTLNLKSKQPIEEIVDKRGKIRQQINWDLDMGGAKYKIYIQKIIK